MSIKDLLKNKKLIEPIIDECYELIDDYHNNRWVIKYTLINLRNKINDLEEKNII